MSGEIFYTANCSSCKRVIALKCTPVAPIQTVWKWLVEEHERVPLEKSGEPCKARIETFTVDFRERQNGSPI